jgi:hypothetical protein
LPDPALFDGSTLAPEKKSEYGMLGDFELPGDENAKGDKVGGQQQGGGGGGQPDPKAGQGGQGGMPPLGIPPGAGGGQAQSGQQPPKNGAPGGPGGGQNDPNAKAEGIQVAELKTDESAGPAGGGGESDPNSQKPKPVAIGDPTRQIKPAANAPGVVGAQTTAGQTQQMEKAVGGSGKASPGNNSNKGVEKGRAMPAGL